METAAKERMILSCESPAMSQSYCLAAASDAGTWENMKGTPLDIFGPRDATSDTAPPKLSPGVVHLWQQRLQTDEDSVQACHALLLPEEVQKAMRYRVERPRSDYILTRGTLRLLLSRYLGIAATEFNFQYTEYGKPFLANSDLHFNVSHTDGLALLAFVRNRQIGIDVEKVRAQDDLQKLAERFFSTHERHSLRNLAGRELHNAFFRCWTRKEAYIKAVGEGLSLPLHQFDVSLEPNPTEALIATRPDPEQATRWTIRDVPVASGYVAALAVSAECE
jgi:4'-phosphopantetheinyl transferase